MTETKPRIIAPAEIPSDITAIETRHGVRYERQIRRPGFWYVVEGGRRRLAAFLTSAELLSPEHAPLKEIVVSPPPFQQ